MFSVPTSQDVSVSVAPNCDFTIKCGKSSEAASSSSSLCVCVGGSPQKLFWGLALAMGWDTCSDLVDESFKSPCFSQVP